METERIKVNTLIASLVIVMIIELAARFVVLEIEYSPTAILGMARLLEIILMILVVQNREPGTSSIGLERSNILHGMRRGLIWSAGFGAVTSIAFLLLFFAEINPLRLMQANLPARFHEIFLLLLIGGVLGPVAEEVFFRGILYGFFRRWGILLAIVLSTGMFIGVHYIFSGISFPQVIGGIVFAIAYETEKNLMVPITVHVMSNMAILTISLTG